MNNEQWSKHKTGLTVIAVLICLVAIPSAISFFKVPYYGFQTDPGYSIINILSNGPAETAGLKVGDVLKSDNGIDMEDLKSRIQKPQSKIGETVTLMIERDGNPQEVKVNLTGQPLPPKIHWLFINTLGLSMILASLYVYRKVQTPITFICLCCGVLVGCFHFPIFGINSVTIRLVYDVFMEAIIWCGLGLAAYLFMLFPKPKALLDKKYTKPLLFAPAAISILFLIIVLVFKPDATGALNYSNQVVWSVSRIFYMLWCTIAIIHSYLKATSEERQSYGLHILAVGIVAGITPFLLLLIMGILAPKVILPGQMYYDVPMILIPFAVATAILKTERLKAEDSLKVNA